MTEQERIKNLFSRLDLFKTLHHINPISKNEWDIKRCKKFNEKMDTDIRNIKIKVLKEGIDSATMNLWREYGFSN